MGLLIDALPFGVNSHIDLVCSFYRDNGQALGLSFSSDGSFDLLSFMIYGFFS